MMTAYKLLTGSAKICCWSWQLHEGISNMASLPRWFSQYQIKKLSPKKVQMAIKLEGACWRFDQLWRNFFCGFVKPCFSTRQHNLKIVEVKYFLNLDWKQNKKKSLKKKRYFLFFISQALTYIPGSPIQLRKTAPLICLKPRLILILMT